MISFTGRNPRPIRDAVSRQSPESPSGSGLLYAVCGNTTLIIRRNKAKATSSPSDHFEHVGGRCRVGRRGRERIAAQAAFDEFDDMLVAVGECAVDQRFGQR